MCAVSCWKSYLERTDHLRDKQSGSSPDRLFLHCSQNDTYTCPNLSNIFLFQLLLRWLSRVLNNEDIVPLFEEVLVEAGLDPLNSKGMMLSFQIPCEIPNENVHFATVVRELFEDPATLIELDEGIKIARYGHVTCSRYNKPEVRLSCNIARDLYSLSFDCSFRQYCILSRRKICLQNV